MATEIRLPKLGQTMEEGTIVGCRVEVGDEVKKGDVIFEIETDKATMEVEAPADGFVKHVMAELDRTYPVGTPILVIGHKNEDVPRSFVDALLEETQAASAPASQPEAAGMIGEEDAGKPAVEPAFDNAVAGDQAALGSTVRLSRLQRITADRMLKSKREIPCFYLTVQVDVTSLVALRAKMNEASDVEVAYNDFIIKVVAAGLEKYPLMTGQLAGNHIELAQAIHVGLAVSIPDGVVAPILKDVNSKTVGRIARDRQALVERARADKLDLSDIEGGCISVSNLGAFGIDSFIPIVVPGQCSILGVGQITDTCVPDNGGIAIRKLMKMTLSVDHKVANGAYAAQFLDFVKKTLEDPQQFTI
jgi:pyruvate dehydrogenase E2 component (dihydrolipoamide acetyltransferase)